MWSSRKTPRRSCASESQRELGNPHEETPGMKAVVMAGGEGSRLRPLTSGDALTDIDLGAVMQYHREKGASATIVLTSVANPLEFGVVITNPDGTIKRFLEKPSWGEVFSDQVNTGIYIIEPEVLDLLPPAALVDW